MKTVSIINQVIGKTFSEYDSFNGSDWKFKIEDVLIGTGNHITLVGHGLDFFGGDTDEERSYEVTTEQLVGMIENYGGIVLLITVVDHCSCKKIINIF